jgi:predicted alpha/beta hydrolase family esterase
MNSTILFVPGLRDHVADHWQTLLAAEIPGARTVAPLEADKLSRAARVAALDAAIAEISGPLVLAAHSAGCLTVAHWAQSHRREDMAALLATPADIETPLPPGYPTPAELTAGGWLPLPLEPLPFRTLVAASLNDPLCAHPRAMSLARAWGSDVVTLADAGHLNPASGFGPWPDGLDFLERLDRQLQADSEREGS